MLVLPMILYIICITLVSILILWLGNHPLYAKPQDILKTMPVVAYLPVVVALIEAITLFFIVVQFTHVPGKMLSYQYN